MARFLIDRVDSRRPCVIKETNGKQKCLFHRWSQESWIVPPSLLKGGHTGGTVSTIMAVMEFEDGSVRLIKPNAFKFCDSNGGFLDFSWEKEDEQNDSNQDK